MRLAVPQEAKTRITIGSSNFTSRFQKQDSKEEIRSEPHHSQQPKGSVHSQMDRSTNVVSAHGGIVFSHEEECSSAPCWNVVAREDGTLSGIRQDNMTPLRLRAT